MKLWRNLDIGLGNNDIESCLGEESGLNERNL